MSHAYRLGLSHQRISLLLHPHVKFVFAKMALEASRTAFVFTRQVCTGILAVIPPLLDKYKTYTDFHRTARQSA